jgi:hypothetical protein
MRLRGGVRRMQRGELVQDKLCFVQFIHPGKEHRPDAGRIKSWNRSKHKRKFLRNGGTYLHEGKLKEGEIVFWAEWEPESEVVKEIESPRTNGPQYVYTPYYVVPSSFKDVQNTDPFVFGERFYYTTCLQEKKGRPTQLRHIDEGSVILFGSLSEQTYFVVDTVFVVAGWIEHSRVNYRERLSEPVPEAYKHVTISPLYKEPFGEKRSLPVISPESWRLYFGATYENPLNGMFSFFPCLPYEDGEEGFARPRVRITNGITDNLPQFFKLTPQQSVHWVRALWDDVKKQVEEQGLKLGVFTALPQRRLQ